MKQVAIVTDAADSTEVLVPDAVADKWIAAGFLIERPRVHSEEDRVTSLVEPYRSNHMVVSLIEALGD